MKEVVSIFACLVICVMAAFSQSIRIPVDPVIQHTPQHVDIPAHGGGSTTNILHVYYVTNISYVSVTNWTYVTVNQTNIFNVTNPVVVFQTNLVNVFNVTNLTVSQTNLTLLTITNLTTVTNAGPRGVLKMPSTVINPALNSDWGVALNGATTFTLGAFQANDDALLWISNPGSNRMTWPTGLVLPFGPLPTNQGAACVWFKNVNGQIWAQ